MSEWLSGLKLIHCVVRVGCDLSPLITKDFVSSVEKLIIDTQFIVFTWAIINEYSGLWGNLTYKLCLTMLSR